MYLAALVKIEMKLRTTMQYNKTYEDMTEGITIKLAKEWQITVSSVINNMNNSYMYIYIFIYNISDWKQTLFEKQ